MTIDVDNYCYTPFLHPVEEAMGRCRGETLTFSSALEMSCYLSMNPDFSSKLQNVIEEKFEACDRYKDLKKKRSLLKDIPSFRYYRKKNRSFNESVANLGSGIKISNKELSHIKGLGDEIDASLTKIVKGQKFFYGLGEAQYLQIKAGSAVPYFLSTSLSITVAQQHAIRKSARGIYGNIIGRPTVLLIEAKASYQCIFAPIGQPAEHELLFKKGACFQFRKAHSENRGEFQIIEADLVGFSN